MGARPAPAPGLGRLPKASLDRSFTTGRVTCSGPGYHGNPQPRLPPEPQMAASSEDGHSGAPALPPASARVSPGPAAPLWAWEQGREVWSPGLGPSRGAQEPECPGRGRGQPDGGTTRDRGFRASALHGDGGPTPPTPGRETERNCGGLYWVLWGEASLWGGGRAAAGHQGPHHQAQRPPPLSWCHLPGGPSVGASSLTPWMQCVPCRPPGTLSLARAFWGGRCGGSPGFLGVRSSVSRPRWARSGGRVWVGVGRFLVPPWGGPGPPARGRRGGTAGQGAEGSGRSPGWPGARAGVAWPGLVRSRPLRQAPASDPQGPGDAPVRAWGPSVLPWLSGQPPPRPSGDPGRPSWAAPSLPRQAGPPAPGFLAPASPGCPPSPHRPHFPPPAPPGPWGHQTPRLSAGSDCWQCHPRVLGVWWKLRRWNPRAPG